MQITVHLHHYECESCLVFFAVEQAYEDQELVNCPICGTDDHLKDVGAGVTFIDTKKAAAATAG